MVNQTQYWDGRAQTLEDQAKLPLINPIEMGIESHAAVMVKVKSIEGYTRQFEQVFGGEVTIHRIAQAIAAFERSQLSGDAPFGRFFHGDTGALSQSASRGCELFYGKARCQFSHTFVPDTSPFFPIINFIILVSALE